jgi:hypothetical protein
VEVRGTVAFAPQPKPQPVRYEWDSKQQKSVAVPVAIDSPPVTTQLPGETHYVEVESNNFARAHQWASEQVARKFATRRPEAREVLTTLDSLIKQQLAGQPA